MTDIFLKAKHWQLFALLVGIPLIYQIVVMIITFSDAIAGNNPNLDFFGGLFVVFPLIMIISMIIFYGWFWSVGVGLQKYIPGDIKKNVAIFKILLLFPLLYIFTIFVFAGITLLDFIDLNNIEESNIFLAVAIILPLHLFSMFCQFHSLYFVAKTFKQAELQKAVKFDEYIGEFFLLWFFPVGVWFIQPKINKIVTKIDNDQPALK